MSWWQIWMFLHVLAAIVAFGPSFIFPLVVKLGRDHPMHMPFVSLLTVTIEEKVTAPLAASLAVSGIGLIAVGKIDFVGTAWLVASTVVYVLALGYSLFAQQPAGRRMLALMRELPPGPPPEGQGPPPEIAALGRRLTVGGAILTASTLAILVLMIWKPGGTSFT